MIYEVYPLFLLGKFACAAGNVINITHIKKTSFTYFPPSIDQNDHLPQT